MLKVIVYDGGYGGELFADQLERELPIVEVIRVIDWRHADTLQTSPIKSREIIKTALRPYIGKVDLIIFANYFLTATCLRYFRHKYKNQKFLGLNFKCPSGSTTPKAQRPSKLPKPSKQTAILTTSTTTRTINYQKYRLSLRGKVRTLTLDSWPAKIDDGELSSDEIRLALIASLPNAPSEIILACSHFSDIKAELRATFGRNLKISDGFNDAIIATCKVLKIRGGTGKRKP